MRACLYYELYVILNDVMDKKETIWSMNFILLFATNGVMFFGQYMMSAILPKYLNELGIASTIIGIIMGMFSVTALGTRPFTGPLIDSMNKKTLYLIMQVILAVASIGYGFADNVPLLILFRLLHDLSMGCSSALALTMVSDILPGNKIAYGVGIYGLSNVLPAAFGPGAGLLLMESFGYTNTFIASGVLVIAATILLTRIKLADSPLQNFQIRLSSIVAREALVPAFLIFMLSLARAGIMTFLVIYITDVRQIPGISAYYLVSAGVLLIARPVMGKIADRYGIHIALIPSLFFFSANLVLLAFCTQTWQLILIAVVNALGLGTAFSSLQALCMKVVPANRRGAGSSTFFIGLDLGDLTGPTIAGALIQFSGYREMYLASLIPVAVCAFVLYLWVRRGSFSKAAP